MAHTLCKGWLSCCCTNSDMLLIAALIAALIAHTCCPPTMCVRLAEQLPASLKSQEGGYRRATPRRLSGQLSRHKNDCEEGGCKDGRVCCLLLAIAAAAVIAVTRMLHAQG